MWKRFPHAALAALAAGTVSGCIGTMLDAAPGEDPRVRDFVPTETSCPIDPDAYIGGDASLYECPDYWICEDIPAGKRCYTPGPDQPDGGEWRCWDEGGATYCEGDDFPDGGNGDGWDCERRGEFVICRDDTPDYPDGGGSGDWDCFFADEFRVCDSGGGDYPGGGGGGGFPGGGDYPGEGEGWCFYPTGESGGPPIVVGGFEFETVGGRDTIHISLIFSEAFVDNSYGANSSDGYRGGGPGSHTFRDLVSSDHAEVGFTNGAGTEVLRAKFDYITAAGTASGYDSLGVVGGDGSMIAGDASAVVDATSSLDRNFNERDCVFTESSPTAAECPSWDNRVVYEMWLDLAAFGSSGFGMPALSSVHASPSRTDDTIPVTPGPCP